MASKQVAKRLFGVGVGVSALSAAGGAAAQLWDRLSWRKSVLGKTAQRSRAACPAVAVPRRSSETNSVRILSQNVWNSFFAGGPNRAARLKAFADHLTRLDVDVVVAQEMFVLGLGPLMDCGDALAASDAMYDLGFVHQTSAFSTLPSFGQTSGLVVYSKLPIVSEAHDVFAERRSVSRKGWQTVELDVSGLVDDKGSPDRLVLLNTHLEHAHEPPWRIVREQQWRQLASSAAEKVRGFRESPFVLAMGDFNVCSEDVGERLDGGAEYAALRSEFAEAGLPCDLVESPLQPTLRQPPTDEALRCSLDHVLVTVALQDRGACAKVVDTRGADGLLVSDHRGVLVELKF
eukprot:TRINITY_DN50001_c0_g1_i1.p1 TRINITY_DN50001_c0_g1~~TRINITY_DN50001_c0_g1_i1.p1  ORF type:complete len:347 (-),score=76.15 TRINITY_DN50001_c0_g1_i1:36-1076(-)